MSSRKKIMIIILLSLTAVVAVVSVLFFATMPQEIDASEEMMLVNVYFRNNATNRLEPEVREIRAADKQVMVEDIMDALMSGPRGVSLVRSVPGDPELIREITYPPENDDKNIATIDFHKKYHSLTAAEALYCRSALVWTLTELPFIDGIIFSVEQEEILKTSGQAVGMQNRDNVVLNPEIPVEKTNVQKVVLYFSDNQANGLWAEERYIEVNPDQSMEEYIMLELLKGPETPDLINLIPSDTSLIRARTEETICIVDLSRAFVDKHVGGSTAVRHTIYSIVNSLCELSNVKKVQFLIEGQKIQDFKGMMDLTKPLEPDPSIILTDEDV